MKKTLLAAAIAAFAASAASAATVYDKDGTSLAIGGRVETMYFSNHVSGMKSEDQTVSDRVRLNVDGRTALTSTISAYGFYEWQVEHAGDSTEAQQVKARYAYLGVDFGDFGAVQVGRYEDPFEYAGNVVDNLEEYGNYCGMDERNSGHLSYMWSGFGFDAGVSYQFAEDAYNADGFGDVNVDDGYSVYAGYTTPTVGFGPISVRAAYLYLNTQHGKDATDTNGNIKSVDFGTSWGNMGDGFYVATNYNTSKLKSADSESYYKIKAWESMVSYGFDSGVVMSAAYSYIQEAKEAGEGRTDLDTKFVELIASYDVNENFRVWAEGLIDAGSDDGERVLGTTKTEDGKTKGGNAVIIGARYTF